MTQKSRCSSVVEHFLGKEEVKGSIPFNGSGVWRPEERLTRFRFFKVLLTKDQNDEGCDATKADSSILPAAVRCCWLHNKKTIIDKNTI
jgi:hypothetical protein